MPIPDPWRAIDQLWEAVEAITHRLDHAQAHPVVCVPPEGVSLREIERMAILQALEMSNWVQTDAARLLHISARMMGYYVRAHKLRREDVTTTPIPPSGRYKLRVPYDGTIPRGERHGRVRDPAHDHARDPATDDGGPAPHRQ